MSSAICFNLDQSKILSSGSGLNQGLSDRHEYVSETNNQIPSWHKTTRNIWRTNTFVLFLPFQILHLQIRYTIPFSNQTTQFRWQKGVHFIH